MLFFWQLPKHWRPLIPKSTTNTTIPTSYLHKIHHIQFSRKQLLFSFGVFFACRAHCYAAGRLQAVQQQGQQYFKFFSKNIIAKEEKKSREINEDIIIMLQQIF